MAWLHTWTGLLVGWVLFFVFLTGTFGYVNSEIDRWMEPELPLASSALPASSLLPTAERFLRREAAEASAWYIFFPGHRNITDLEVGWQQQEQSQEVEHNEEHYAEPTYALLSPSTGEPIERTVRETAGGSALYYMHYTLYYIPYEWATRIVGICSMFMLVAILSGVVTHKKVFKDFFTFRPGKGQRSWLDGHNLLSVTSLPYHLMITWTGLVYYMFAYMPLAPDAFYPDSNDLTDSVFAEVYRREAEQQPGSPAPLISLAPLLAQAEQEWGTGKVSQIIIDHPGRSNALITFSPYNVADHSSGVDKLRFNGVSGARLPDQQASAPGRFQTVLFELHEGLFAGWSLRFLFVIAGLAGTAMIATGLVLWSTKRTAPLAKNSRPHFGMAAVDVLNVGTIIGLPISIAVYFWSNRLIPARLEERDHWEIHAMFIAWALTFVYAIWRRQGRAWIELTWLAAAVWGLLPVVNALTTDRHLGVTMPANDWVLASIDLGMLVSGVFFVFLALIMQRKQAKGAAPARHVGAVTVSEAD